MRATRTKLAVLLAALAGLAGTAALPPLVGRLSNDKSPHTPPGRLVPQLVSLDVIIPAYLEASIITTKVADLRASFAFTKVTSRIVVVASDRLTATAAEEAGADLVILTAREGKAKAVNLAISQSTADLVALTDANCSIQPAEWVDIALDELSDANLISAVKTESGGDEGLLQLLDRFLRQGPSGTRSSIAVYGEFVMMRRAEYEPIPEDIILDDVALGLSFGRRALKVATTSRIRTVEPSPTRPEQWERRLRIAEGLLTESISQLPQLVKFRAGRIFAAHKVYRVSLAPASFWVAVVVACTIVPEAAPVVVVATPFLVLGYAGRVPLPRYVGPLAALVGLQAVPVVAAIRAIRAARSPKQHKALWRKIVR